MPTAAEKQLRGAADVPLDGIKLANFRKLAESLAGWIESGQVKVSFRLPDAIWFQFDEKKIATELKRKRLPQASMAQLRMDIPLMLWAILTGQRASTSSFLTGAASVPEDKGTERPERVAIQKAVDARISCIEETVVTPDLRRQYAVKSTATTSTYVRAKWGVDEKHSSSSGGLLPGLVYATVHIDVQHPTEAGQAPSMPNVLLAPLMNLVAPRSAEGLTLTMTRQDLLDLAESLERAAEALKEAAQDETR